MGFKISNLIASEIVRNEDIGARVSAIEKWVAVADICRCLHNYNAVLEITSSMNRSAIFRLKKTWLKVSKQVGGWAAGNHRGLGPGREPETLSCITWHRVAGPQVGPGGLGIHNSHVRNEKGGDKVLTIGPHSLLLELGQAWGFTRTPARACRCLRRCPGIQRPLLRTSVLKTPQEGPARALSCPAWVQGGRF